jgi:exoribonuclease R
LESIRHDFGDLPVFVIDDVVAEELDDGISIEPVASDSRSHWIHIHVADPTRILPPTHHIALKAREVSETMYFNHGSVPMLPPQLHQMSLGKASATGTPEHVMTFSVKVNDSGDIVDYKVRAGIIRNVQILTYEDVDQVINAPVFQASYPFKSGALPPVPAPPNLDQSYIQQLQNLYKVARNIVAGAHRSGTFSYSFPSSDVSFKQKGLPSTVNLDRLDKPVLFRGFPEMEYKVNNPDVVHSGARLMVSEFMKAASRAASRFAADRGIPLIRRSSAKAYIPNEKVLEDLLAVRNERGRVDPIVVLRSGIVVPRITNTPLPKGHWVLGIPEGEGYVRATSPLRRFADLITHWQIKHTLLNPSSSPLFSLDWMFDFANELTMKERHTRKLSNQHRVYWSSLYVGRWFDGLMDTDLDRGSTFEADVCGVPAKSYASGMWYTRVLLPELGLWGELVGDGIVQREIGTRVKARIVEVVKGVRPLVRLSAV